MMSGSIAPVTAMDSGPTSFTSTGPTRKLANGRQSPTSPLKLFGQAKKKINDIFVEISSYVLESGEFLEGISTLHYIRLIIGFCMFGCEACI